MLKRIGYVLFAIMYYAGCIRKVRCDRFFCVMTHDGSDDSSVGVVISGIRKRMPGARFVCVKKADRGIKGLFDLIFRKSFALAASGTVLMDNEFLPLGYVKIRDNVKVVQLWHGTGTIKKFGHDANEGSLLMLVEKADKRITHLIVNSDYTAKLYQSAFGVGEDKVYLTGIPRTDIMFDDDIRESCIRTLLNEYPYIEGKRIVLYAPTFRDREVDNPVSGLDIDRWCEIMDSDTVLLIRMHPHVAARFDDTKLLQFGNKVINVSGYNDLNALLFAADMLVTDYSSVIFEYVLLDRPLYFLAYDLEEFRKDSRGFYEEYESFVPGPVVRTTDELIKAVNDVDSYHTVRDEFKNKFYKYLDGRSTERVLDTILR